MKDIAKIIFLVLNIWSLNILPSLSQSGVNNIINRPTLSVESQGNVVAELQAALKLLGYYNGKVDGIYSDKVKESVSQFQQAAGLNSNGIVDNLTWNTLFPLQPVDKKNSVATNSNTNNSDTTTQNSSNNNTSTNNSNNKPAQNTNNNATNTIQNQNINQKPQLIAANMPVLKEGMEGETVKQLQERLKILGFLKEPIDGVFGANTREAVIAAQGKFKIGADGIVGYQTWKALLGQ